MKQIRFGHCALILCVVLLCSSCSLPDISTLLMSKSERDAYFHNAPLFWNQAIAVEGADNLYELQNDLFWGKPYNNIARFGDNILCIGEASYNSFLNESFSETESKTYEFSFEVYSPWYNLITASLSHKDISCTSYQVCDDILFLLDSDNQKLTLYDNELKSLGTYSMSDWNNLDRMRFYPSGIEHTFYVVDSDSETFARLCFSKKDVSVVPISLPYYDIRVLYASSSEHSITLSGVDSSSLQDMIIVFDTVSGAFSAEEPSEMFLQSQWPLEDAFTSSGDILLRGFSVSEKPAHYLGSFSYYDKNGTGISHITYDCGNLRSSSDFKYLAADYAVFEEQALCFLLVYNMDCQPYLLVWDLSQDSSDMPPLFDGTNISDVDTESTNWGVLSDVRTRADLLEQLYQVEIVFGEELPQTVGIYQIAAESDVEELSKCLDVLSDSLSCYPKNFFPQLCLGENNGISIYLAKDITGDTKGMLSTPTGFIDSIDNRLVVVLNTAYRWDWDYTINHEISHMIDRRLEYRLNYIEDSLFSEEKWSSYNPEGCDYLNTYEGYEDNEMYELYSDYFADAYGLTFATEDRAELFGLSMSDYLGYFDEDAFFAKDSPTYDKFNYYCACIRDGFDTTDWDDVMPWEKILQ